MSGPQKHDLDLLDPDPFSTALLILGTAAGIGSLLIGIGNTLREDERDQIAKDDRDSLVRLWIHRIDKKVEGIFEALKRLVQLFEYQGCLSTKPRLGAFSMVLPRPTYMTVKEDREMIAQAGLSIEECIEELVPLLSKDEQDIAFELSSDLSEQFDTYKRAEDVGSILSIACNVLLKVCKYVELLGMRYQYEARSNSKEFQQLLDKLSVNRFYYNEG